MSAVADSRVADAIFVLSRFPQRITLPTPLSGSSPAALPGTYPMSDLRFWIVTFIPWLVAGCASPLHLTTDDRPTIRLAGYDQTDRKTVYVVGHGWHTGIVLRRSDVSTEVWPEVGDFPDMDFVEIGWGDEGFYRAKKITVPLALKAAFWPTPSVLHVAAFQGRVKRFFAVSDIIEIEVTDKQFDTMCRYIATTFSRDNDKRPKQLGRGLYGKSFFYRANGKYYFPKTCNVWTARTLESAGLRVIPQIAITADNVLSQTGRFGHVVQKSSRGLKQAALRAAE